ncbi:sensor histidine kinase [Viridibacterium curvum]|uniref:histidine kinase n=1 Tax=Viridibacterium curvum TaxID=1101404 RepID=A0ABP9QLQ7_9RHOO
MRLSRLLRRLGGKRGDTLAPGASYSLFGEILDWMLAPLLFLWPISIILTYDVATHIANQPYDQALADQVRAISRQIRSSADGGISVDLSASASRLLRSDTEDTVYYQIVSPQGRLLAGDPEVPAPETSELRAGEIHFHDADIQGEGIRVASLLVEPGPAVSGLVTVQVAETRNKRSSLSSRIVSGVLLPQFAIIPLAVLLVWFGLSRGIAPLGELQGLIRARRPGDLSPIAPGSVPEEVRPLIVAFNDMMERLDTLLHAQQHFIADAAHQMRTPLAGLKMQIELAAQERDPEQIRAAMQRALSGADRAARLINQLLSLARADASSENVHSFAEVDLIALVREIVAASVPLALRSGLDIGVEAGSETLLLQGNDILLGELVSNLVDNAIQYTPAGGQITVSVSRQPAGILLAVVDNGPGIAAAERERVFQRFYRIMGARSGGSGLGLAIVSEVAEIHGATVTLADNPAGRGLRVEVLFPLHGTGTEGEPATYAS